jgi:hypothetical protein
MPEEKEIIRLTIEITKPDLEALKSQLRSGGGNQPLSATEAIGRAVKAYQSWARSVRLDEPERKEIESRAGATTPLRNSKDILRAFEKLAGGPDAITVDIDPGLADPMRDVGRGLGYGLSEFAKIILEDSFASNHMYTCELKPLYFQKKEWDALTSALGKERIRSGGELLSLILAMKPSEVDPGAHLPASLPSVNL